MISTGQSLTYFSILCASDWLLSHGELCWSQNARRRRGSVDCASRLNPRFSPYLCIVSSCRDQILLGIAMAMTSWNLQFMDALMGTILCTQNVYSRHYNIPMESHYLLYCHFWYSRWLKVSSSNNNPRFIASFNAYVKHSNPHIYTN